MRCDCGFETRPEWKVAYPFTCKCGRQYRRPCENSTRVEITNYPKQTRPWPSWAQWISERRTEGEVGVGDTLERLLAKFGGRVLKKMMESVGLPCGCDKRQLDYNTIYSYEQLQDRNQPDE